MHRKRRQVAADQSAVEPAHSKKDNSDMKLIRPHGGTLINREVTGTERERLIESAANMPALRLGAREISDLEMIATGAYSPLEGFLDRSDYSAVCSNMRLAIEFSRPEVAQVLIDAQRAVA